MGASKYGVRRDRAATLTFTPLQRKHSIYINDAQSLNIEDLEITCWGQPNVDPTIRDHLFVGPNDVRWYINNEDITSALLDELKAKLASIPKEDLEVQYMAGVEGYLETMKLIEESLGVNVSELRQLARELAKQGLPQLLTKFCDRTVGWSGILHPAFYIFRDISISPISLTSVWQRHQTSEGKDPNQTLKEIPLRKLSICQGWSPSGGLSSTDPYSLGQVDYVVTSIYANPLRKPLEEFAERLKQIDAQLEQLRVSYLGPTQDALSEATIEAKNGLDACKSALEDIRTTVLEIRP